MEAEAEQEEKEEETDASEKGVQKIAMENDVEQNTESAPPATPLRGGR